MISGITQLLIVGAVSGAMAAGSAWKVQGWRYEGEISSMVAEHATDVALQTKAVRAIEQAHFKQVQDAEKESKEREKNHRIIMQLANDESDGLRLDLTALEDRMPKDTGPAERERTATFSRLLGDCTASYTEMADKAQKHSNDLRLILGAWPK